MIAAAAQTIAWDKPLFNWFDVFLVLILAFGLWRGRKRGMSKEFVSVFEALVLVIGCGFGYDIIGQLLIKGGVIHSVFGTMFTERTAASITGYALVALLVIFIFSFFKRTLKPKMEGSNIFGGGEYYLGMMGGAIRYACYALVAMALLNAPIYSLVEIEAQRAFDKKTFGGGLYEGNYFLHVNTIQEHVFKESLLGPSIKKYLGVWMINAPVPGAPKPAAPKPV